MPSFSNVELDVKLDVSGMKTMVGQWDFSEAMNNTLVSPAVALMAAYSHRKLTEELSWSGWSQVAASGKSSRNLFVAKVKGVGSLSDASYAIYEGDVTNANAIMRLGGKKQKRPPVQTIKAWIYQKGLSRFGNAIQTIVQTGTSMNRAANPVEELAWRISGGIARKGTSVDHKRLYPKGQKRFDYVAYMVQQRGMLKEAAKEVTYDLGLTRWPSFVAYLRTGKHGKGSKVVASTVMGKANRTF
jgi:hypothetical protein